MKKLILLVLMLSISTVALAVQEEFVAVRFRVPSAEGEGDFSSVIYYPLSSWPVDQAVIDKDIEVLVEDYLAIVKNPAPQIPPTEEELNVALAALNEQKSIVENEIIVTQEKINEAKENANDKEPPSIPVNLVPFKVTAQQINFSWDASTDNTGVVGYEITRDGSEYGSSSGESFSDFKVEKGQSYTYAVRAIDKNKNFSDFSEDIKIVAEDADGKVSDGVIDVIEVTP